VAIDEPSRAEARALPLALAATAAAYAVVQFVLYFSEATYYGTFLSYLLNFETHPGTRYLGPFVFHPAFYPPFYYGFLYLVHQVAGFHFVAFAAVNALFPFGGAIYAGLAVRRLAGREAGALAFCAFLLFPARAAFTATLLIEAPLLLFVPAFLYHALASERFLRRHHALAAGVYFALGMLTKWSFFAYASCPATFLVADAFFDFGALRRRRVQRAQRVNVLLAAGLAALVAGPWYLGPFNLRLFRASAANDPTFPVYSRAANMRYNLSFLRDFTGRPTAVALGVLVLVAAILEPPVPRVLGWMALLVGTPLAFFTLPGHLEDRYLWPIFPGMAVVAGIAWGAVRRRVPWPTLRQALLVALVGVLALTNWKAFVAERGNRDRLELDKNYAHGSPFWERADSGAVLRALDDALRTARTPNRPLTVAVHPFMTDAHISSMHLRYHRLLDPAFTRFNILGTTFYQYPELMAEARAGKIDVILVDADRWRRYAAPDFDPRGDVIRHMLDRPYVDQTNGKVFRTLDMAGFRDDMRFLETDYRRVREARLAKNTVWILVRRAYEERNGRIADAPGD
jgi:hypothetical protein